MIAKEKLKRILFDRLHATDSQQFDVANAVASRGIVGYAKWNYDTFKKEILEYIESVRVKPYAYKYSASRTSECLYGSIYVAMLEGLLGVLTQRSSIELKEWADYLNSFQSPDDGLFYDHALASDAYEHIGTWNEGWGKHHLRGHIIIAFARLGHTPKYPLRYLEKYYNDKYLKQWMDGFDFSTDVWTASNFFMNLYTVLEYARDYMNEKKAQSAIETMTSWIMDKQNPNTGMWHDKDFHSLGHLDKLKIVRAAYHFYPLFEYEGFAIPYAEKIVDSILPLQNSWGGWTEEGGNSGACEDIDAIEPLIRCASAAPDRTEEIRSSVLRSIVWQMASRNADKGFSFYVRSQQEYGGHPLTTSLRDESSLFATWFRTLCLAYETQYLGIHNKFDIGHYPGYEIRL